MSTKGYTSSARTSNPVGAYAEIPGSEFGVLGGAAPSVAYNAGAGSLAMGSAFVKVTWITAEGESLASAEGTVVVSAGTGAVTITKPTTPTGAVGWRVYSAGTTAIEQLNVVALSTTQVQQNFTTNQGVLAGFPVATTAVQVLIYGDGASVPTVDHSGVQLPLPSIAANTTADYNFVVPNTGSQWKVQKSVACMRPDGTAETAGVSLGTLDCIAPIYPGNSSSAALGSYIVLNQVLYVCTTAGTTAASIQPSTFNTAKGATTTDGAAVWTSLGRAILVRAHFINAAGSAKIPQAMEYDFFQA